MWIDRKGRVHYLCGESAKSKFAAKSHHRMAQLRGRAALDKLIEFEKKYGDYL